MVNRLRVLTLCGATVGDEDLWAADNITLSESYLQTVIVYLQYYRVVILTKVEKKLRHFATQPSSPDFLKTMNRPDSRVDPNRSQLRCIMVKVLKFY
jgi:hypothetical protein